MNIKLAEDGIGHPELFNILAEVDPSDPPNCLSFLQENSLRGLKNFFTGSADQVEQKLQGDVDTIRTKWKLILIDAIYFLRINDHREGAFYETSDPLREGGVKEKTTMSSDGVSKSAEANVYGIKELSEYFSQFTKFESALYGADKYYRDHVIHPLNVWLTGLNIISKYGSKIEFRSSSKIEIADTAHAEEGWFKGDTIDGQEGEGEENILPRLSTAELSAMWAVIALTHDIGYPLEKVEKVNDQLEKMLAQFGNIGFSRSRFNFENQHDHLVKFLLKLISSTAKDTIERDKENNLLWINHLQTKYYTKFSKSWEQFDHGIVSCLLLLKTLTYFIETDYSTEHNKLLSCEDARQFSIRSEILHTIASHTTPKIYHIFINNLPFLLIFCDDIQEWSRPTFSDIRAGLRGSAKSVNIEKFIINDDGDSEIVCQINYQAAAIKKQRDFIRRSFSQWTERLRPALDDKKRSFKICWKVQFEGSSEWAFKLDNTEKNVFKKITIDALDDNGQEINWTLADLSDDNITS